MTLIRFHILSLRLRQDAPFPSKIAALQASRKIGVRRFPQPERLRSKPGDPAPCARRLVGEQPDGDGKEEEDGGLRDHDGLSVRLVKIPLIRWVFRLLDGKFGIKSEGYLELGVFIA